MERIKAVNEKVNELKTAGLKPAEVIVIDAQYKKAASKYSPK